MINTEEQNSFHKQLKQSMDEFVEKVYNSSKNFPRDELFGVTSQLRRSALSIILNYVEGYARQRRAVMKNFLETSYGSLKESDYLIYFSHKRGWIDNSSYSRMSSLSDRIGAMLWGTIHNIK